MRIEQLDSLVEISKNKSLSAASKNVHMSVQGLSMSIKALEEELGIQLLNRTYKGVSMTENGEKLVALYRSFNLGLQYLIQSGSRLESVRLAGHLKIPVNFFGLVDFLPHLICDLTLEMPDLLIEVIEMPQSQIIEQLLQEAIDFGFICICCIDHQETYVLDQTLTFYPLVESKIICQMHKKHPISDYKTISIKNALNYPGIIYQPSVESQYTLCDLLGRFGDVKNVMITNSPALYQEMVSSGQRIGFAPLVNNVSIGKTTHDIIHIPVREDATSQFGYATKKGHRLPEIPAYFLSYLNKYSALVNKP